MILYLQGIDTTALPNTWIQLIGVLIAAASTGFAAWIGYRASLAEKRFKAEEAIRQAKEEEDKKDVAAALGAQDEVRRIRDEMRRDARSRELRLLRELDEVRDELRQTNQLNHQLQMTIARLESSNARLEQSNRELQTKVDTLQSALHRMEQRGM